MSSSFAQAQEAWKDAIGQLRYTLNRADYEAWVRDARPLSYNGGVLTVGVANSYARDWLDNRLRTTLETLLRALLNEPVKLVFTVAEPRSQPPNGTIVPQAKIPRSPHLDLSAISLRLRDALIQPQRVVFLPGYFLRWLPYIGTRAGWLYVALRQAHFLSNLAPHGPGTRIPAGQAVEVQRATLAYWSALTPRTINNILNRGLLNPLVRVERDRHLYANRQAPNRYIFTADLPLTPDDFQAVMQFLDNHGLQQDPLAALAQAIQQPAASLLASPNAHGATPSPAESKSLRDAVAERVQNLPLSQEQMAKALQMAELLESTIVESAGKIFISWYFIQRHLPRIGHTVAWIYILLRQAAERNGWRGSGGFRILRVSTREIAQSVRLKKVRYVRDLIPALPLDAPPDVHTPPAAAFIRREESRSASFNVAVQTVEPLTPDDAAAYRAATMLMASCIQNKDLTPLTTLQKLVQTGESAKAARLLAELTGSTASEEVLSRAVEALGAISTEAPKISLGEVGKNPQPRQNVPTAVPKNSSGSAKTFPRDSQNLPPK